MMRFRKVLLVSPPSLSRYGGLRVPAGIGYIAQVLHDNSIDYDYVDMRIGYSLRYLRKRVLTFKPDLIGFSMITLGYKKAYQIISDVKRLSPSLKIVAGGHHVTILKEKVLRECEDIDFGVVSDGEQTILELCRDTLAYKDIKGLIYRKGQNILFTGERPPVKNLDEIAFPRFEKFNMGDYSRQIPIHSSRGCVYQCTFCPNKLIAREFRTRSEKNFVDEIEYWYEKGIRQFAIDDDNFALKKKRVYAICDEIEKRGLKDLFIRCSNGLRADSVDRQLLARMKEIGVREIGFGVDGGNNRVLGYLKKGETIETIEQAVKDACELGLDVRLYFLIGSPGETEADIEDSMRLARKYPIGLINVNNPIPYPGTEMYDYIRDHNLFIIPPEEYLNSVPEDKATPVFATPELSRDDRIRMLKRCDRVRRQILKNAAYRMYKHRPVFGRLVKYFFNVALFEKLFFNNLLFRRLFERMRYRRVLKQ
jgi:radical SAM superfamily enzyme YgiQ (UPF0313 family)